VAYLIRATYRDRMCAETAEGIPRHDLLLR
jgi:hypothetical protein